ncbi:sugar transferase, partial [Mangrovicoccus algicola]
LGLTRRVPGLRAIGIGSVGAERTVATAVKAARADILLVAGEEALWLAATARRLPVRLVIGTGALLEDIAGTRSLFAAPLRGLGAGAGIVARGAAARTARIDARAVIRRAGDIALSAGMIAALAPATLAVVAAIRLDSRGPVLFRQTRIGRDGTPFTMFKFRSMHVDAEARRAALIATSDREGICFKSRHDPRVTRIGRILRRFSIDEMPQLWNVLRGDMSLIGPRPALPEEVAAYDARALGRLVVRPGLTGLWQVSGRAEIGFEKMIDLDLAHIRAKSLTLDLMILALTFRAVLGGRGAY